MNNSHHQHTHSPPTATGIYLAMNSKGGDTPISKGGHPHTPTTCNTGHGNSHRRQINRNAPNQTTQLPQQPLPSHGRYQPAGGTTSTGHRLQGTWHQLPGQSDNAHSRHVSCEDTFQQRHINAWSTVHDD